MRRCAPSNGPEETADRLSAFVFNILVPALLFETMSRFSSLPRWIPGCSSPFRQLPDRLRDRPSGRLEAVRHGWNSQSVFAMGGIFSNNVFLGIPLAKATLGEASLPSVSLIVAFNALICGP
jgi:predicted permease